jgi:putative ABC transport system substrate-binding protein
MLVRTRRDFITLVASAASWPLPGRAEPADRQRRIGVLTSGVENDPEIQEHLAGFRQGLKSLGWSEGRNIRVDYRFVGGRPDQYVPIARDLIGLRPDAILVRGTPGAAALLRESRETPIVFVGVSDPVGSGLAKSLARPGGNVTGYLLYEEGIAGKWLSLLKEISPRLSYAALMGNPATMPFDYFLRSATAAASALAIEVEPRPVADAPEIERTINSLSGKPNAGLVVLPDPGGIINRDLIIHLTARHRLPTVYPFRLFVVSGGLMAYETNLLDHYRQSARYIDRILRGDKPMDLPIQAPTRYETILNLRTAKELGLEIPPTLLVRADEVIE